MLNGDHAYMGFWWLVPTVSITIVELFSSAILEDGSPFGTKLSDPCCIDNKHMNVCVDYVYPVLRPNSCTCNETHHEDRWWDLRSTEAGGWDGSLYIIYVSDSYGGEDEEGFSTIQSWFVTDISLVAYSALSNYGLSPISVSGSYRQFPESMKTLVSSLYLSQAGASYITSLMVTIIQNTTGGDDRKNWLDDDINEGLGF